MHDKTLKLINRGHDLKCFDTCVKKLKENNIKVAVHIINGLPYETYDMMMDTVRHLNKLKIDDIYQVIAPFIPAPLIDKATSLNIAHWIDKKGEELYHVYFRR